MKIEDFGGTIEVQDLNNLRDVFARRFGQGVNEMWLRKNIEYPYMGILINNEFAYLHFFPYEKHPGFRSISDQLCDQEGFSVFYTNTPEEEIEVMNEAVVSTSLALKAAEEFFQTGKMPQCVQWFEL